MNLDINNLSKSFYHVPVFQSFSISIKSGERVGLFGPNGSGKTTLLKMISGIMSVDKGEILIGNILQDSENIKTRKSIYYLGHSLGLYPGLTGNENISFISKLYGKSELLVLDVLKKVGLGKLENKLVKFYSQGMLQRLKLATAIILNPEIILLDEPFAGVDPISVGDIQKIIYQLRDKGIGVLITDHNYREMLDTCDHSYVMHSGQIIAEGNKETILSNEDVKKVYLGETAGEH